MNLCQYCQKEEVEKEIASQIAWDRKVRKKDGIESKAS